MIYFIPNNGGKNGVENKRLVGFGRVNMLRQGESKSVVMQMYQEFYQSKERSDFNGKYIVSGACQ